MHVHPPFWAEISAKLIILQNPEESPVTVPSPCQSSFHNARNEISHYNSYLIGHGGKSLEDETSKPSGKKPYGVRQNRRSMAVKGEYSVLKAFHYSLVIDRFPIICFIW